MAIICSRISEIIVSEDVNKIEDTIVAVMVVKLLLGVIDSTIQIINVHTVARLST
jgi:hypothetical protein